MPSIKLSDDAVKYLLNFRWSGNIRQLRNAAEQISVLETQRDINVQTLVSYLPQEGSQLPSVIKNKKNDSDFATERDILYKVLFDMKADLNDLKKLTLELMKNGSAKAQEINPNLIQKIYGQNTENVAKLEESSGYNSSTNKDSENELQEEFEDEFDTQNYLFAETVEEEEMLSLEAKEIELIKKSLEKNKGKRKAAADELGISERTLYRKIKQYDL
jgi:transcriptional regulator with PAS, ATPase and Fis domain